jgi:hypothetical protein
MSVSYKFLNNLHKSDLHTMDAANSGKAWYNSSYMTAVFQNVPPCILVHRFRSFGGDWCLLIHGKRK